MTISITKGQLKKLVKESVQEVLSAEFMKLRSFIVPEISSVEQRDIEKKYIKPTRKRQKTITFKV